MACDLKEEPPPKSHKTLFGKSGSIIESADTFYFPRLFEALPMRISVSFTLSNAEITIAAIQFRPPKLPHWFLIFTNSIRYGLRYF